MPDGCRMAAYATLAILIAAAAAITPPAMHYAVFISTYELLRHLKLPPRHLLTPRLRHITPPLRHAAAPLRR